MSRHVVFGDSRRITQGLFSMARWRWGENMEMVQTSHELNRHESSLYNFPEDSRMEGEASSPVARPFYVSDASSVRDLMP